MEELIRNSFKVFNRENQNVETSKAKVFTGKFHFSTINYIDKKRRRKYGSHAQAYMFFLKKERSSIAIETGRMWGMVHK